ncbi:flagellar protein FlaG [Heyndrickxia acidicola]|uniref:Flagellar protein FlaG n=1 Tax=Heyndrickxia acidicola TaxID=209389 RepID=A0ABU6MMF0_9BACI|nr:flagellar protein FlaG [Heyndrickxia acidicola]MED1204392.1 flagellar protein FlaG [Heyndrickxia acidicola]
MMNRVQGPSASIAVQSNPAQSQNSQGKTADPVSAAPGDKGDGTKNTKENVQKVVDALNKFVSASSTHIQFKFHEKLKEYYVTIVNDQTNQVVQEIPSKKLLDIYAAMNDYLGMIMDKKV